MLVLVYIYHTCRAFQRQSCVSALPYTDERLVLKERAQVFGTTALLLLAISGTTQGSHGRKRLSARRLKRYRCDRINPRLRTVQQCGVMASQHDRLGQL